MLEVNGQVAALHTLKPVTDSSVSDCKDKLSGAEQEFVLHQANILITAVVGQLTNFLTVLLLSL